MKTNTFVIQNRNDELSLIDYLSVKLNISRKKTKSIIDSRDVFVNRRRIWMARHQLRLGDIIEIIHTPVSINQNAIPRALFDNDSYLIINKPAGILSNGPDSVESRLRAQLNLPALTAVHRLDRDTSGCLLLAKTESAATKAISLFRNRKIKKNYHAIVRGEFRWKNYTIAIPIENRPAVTHIKTLDSNKTASLLVVHTDSGRTHQIRKHLLAVQHPVMGDRHYGTRFRESDKTLYVPRQMLHSSNIFFCDPETNCPIRATAPLPNDFRYCLKLFKLR